MRPCGRAGLRHRSRLSPISRQKRVIFAWHILPISGTGTLEPFKPIGQDIPPAHAGFHAALERLTRREEEEIYPAAQRLLSELR